MPQIMAWLKALFAPAPDPRETFVYAFQRQRQLLDRVRQALTDIASAKERLETKTAEVKQKLPHLELQARQALVNGREDMARLALQRRQVAIAELDLLEQQLQEVQQEEQRLSLVEQRVATQIEAFFARQEILAARYNAAEAQTRISEALTGVSQELSDLGIALQRAEEKAEHMQARASAIDGLIEAGVLQTPGAPSADLVTRQLTQLDVTRAVEEDLAALKRSVLEARHPP